MNSSLPEPTYQLSMFTDDLVGVDEAVLDSEALTPEEVRQRSEEALSRLSALRLKGDDGQEAEARWMPLYRKLREGGWAWRVAAYIAWASMPSRYRVPKTQAELATEVLGLSSDRAIQTWRQKNPAIQEQIAILKSDLVYDSLVDALHAMVTVATDPDYKGHSDRKLMFEMTGVYTPSSKLTAEMVRKMGKGQIDMSDLSDDELDTIISSAGHALQDRSRDQAGDEEQAGE